MNIKFVKRGAVIALLVPALSACAANSIYDAPGDVKFGEYNRQTMMAQVINPDPVYDEPAVSSGNNAERAIERYRNGEVTEPEGIETTNVGGGPG